MLGFFTSPLQVAMFLIAIGMPGTTELVIFMIIVLVIFGSSRLPSLMRNLGRSANEFKAGMRDPVSAVKDDEEADEGKDRE
jgi:sec-independent protein translocase protein TatA